MFGTLTKVQATVICAILLAGIVVLGVCLGIFLGTQRDTVRGAIVTNGHECADIGKDILEKGGSAVDAAIAAMFCEGVGMPQSTGLGGGFIMTVYKKSTNVIRTLNAREVAPLAATENMFGGNASLAAKGGLSVAVPGELMGYMRAHEAFGLLDWKELVQPTIDLCRRGHLVTPYLASMFKAREQIILNSESLREIFIDPETGETYPEGTLLKREKLADTLEIIANEGAQALYNGSLTEAFVQDIQDLGGIITAEDMNVYEAEWSNPIKVDLPFDQTLYTFPLPGSGAIMTFIINILKDFLVLEEGESVRNIQRIIESFKYGYGRRTELGDAPFVPGIEDLIANLTSEDYALAIRAQISDNVTHNDPEYYGANTTLASDYGTAHVSILAPNGDAVSITGTINQYFGAGIRSVSTGIILNDEMDDFSAPGIDNGFGIPPSIANYIVPGKRPLSSMCPSIIVDDNGDVRMVVGAAGGTKITSSTALIAIRHLWFNLTLEESIEIKRYHHQLFPMAIEFENDFDMEVVEALAAIGHNYTVAGPADGFAAVTAISSNGEIVASPDIRRQGTVAYIY